MVSSYSHDNLIKAVIQIANSSMLCTDPVFQQGPLFWSWKRCFNLVLHFLIQLQTIIGQNEGFYFVQHRTLKQWLHLWGLTLHRLYSVPLADGVLWSAEKCFEIYKIAVTKHRTFFVTCIPVKVDDPTTTSKLTCDSRDLYTWARSYWRPCA